MKRVHIDAITTAERPGKCVNSQQKAIKPGREQQTHNKFEKFPPNCLRWLTRRVPIFSLNSALTPQTEWREARRKIGHWDSGNLKSWSCKGRQLASKEWLPNSIMTVECGESSTVLSPIIHISSAQFSIAHSEIASDQCFFVQHD